MTMIELNRIYNEDCLEGMKRIPDGSIDMILCDLPYGTTEAESRKVVNRMAKAIGKDIIKLENNEVEE